ncbi:DUF6779 domain-containing protein [Mycobacterium sp. Lab-001]|uniref:DUF6779 domain-containing protein n=1 Tax=Mycobacterium sp. Lab-001 TaxID=3410136 RepID=UPI003D1675E6
MTVLSRGARVRRGGRRPGWALLTALLVLAMGASSALVFTNRVELLKLAVILALWAAVAGAFVSVLYRRQSDADQSRVRDLKLVYDLQLDREISARREYELTVESQLRRELASELRAQSADEVAALRAELNALRTSLEILFDTDLKERPAIETLDTEVPRARAYSEWDRNGAGAPVDWVSSDRVTPGPQHHSPQAPEALGVSNTPDGCSDEPAIIDVPEEPLLPPRRQPPPRERVRFHEAPQETSHAPEPEPQFDFRHRTPPPPQAQARDQDWEPVANGRWLPSGTAAPPGGDPSGRQRGSRHIGADEPFGESREQREPEGYRDSRGGPVPTGSRGERDAPRPHGESGRRSRSRHSAEYRDFGVRNFTVPDEPVVVPPPVRAPAAAPAPAPQPPVPPAAEQQPPRLAPAPAPEPAPRHGGADGSDVANGPPSGGQSVAQLLARLQVESSGVGRRRRRNV